MRVRDDVDQEFDRLRRGGDDSPRVIAKPESEHQVVPCLLTETPGGQLIRPEMIAIVNKGSICEELVFALNLEIVYGDSPT